MLDYLYTALVWDTTVPLNEMKAISIATIIKAESRNRALENGWKIVDKKYYVVQQNAELLGDARGNFVVTKED